MNGAILGRIKKTFLLVGVAVSLSAGVQLVAPSSAEAASAGYFSNKAYVGSGNGGGLLAVVEGGHVWQGKTTFVSFLKNKNSDGGENRNGAAYIVCTILGESSGSSCANSGYIDSTTSRSVTSAGWTELEKRLYASNITVSVLSPRTITANSGRGNGVAAGDIYSNVSITSTRTPVQFFDNGTLVYTYYQECANPIGGIGLPPPPVVIVTPWTTSGTSSAGPTTLRPGQTAYWNHRITGYGPVDKTISWTVTRDGSVRQSGSSAGRDGTIVSPSSSFTASASDAGRTICERISWSPSSDTNTGTSSSAQACVYIPHEYELTPGFSRVGGDKIGDGTDVVTGLSASVRNDGPTSSNPAQYQVVRFLVKGGDGATIGPAGNRNLAWPPCSSLLGMGLFNQGSIDTSKCTSLASGTGTVFSVGTRPITVPPDDISSLNAVVGDLICYMTFVQPYRHDSANTAYSRPFCLKLSKQPKVQLWGGDVRSGGDVATSRTLVGSALHGSWAEYAILARNRIASASGGALSADSGGRTDPDYNGGSGRGHYNKITFANTSSPYGSYASIPQSAIPSSSLLTVPTSSPLASSSSSIADLSTGDRQWRAGNLTITGGTVSGKSIIINSTGTVTISGDIAYAPGPYSSTRDLPQLIIKAKKIIINANVKNVDAWLIAQDSGNGYLSTCGDSFNPAVNWLANLNSTTCTEQLRINGPIIADRLYLRRTHGGGRPDYGVPSEVLNLRPDASLWASGAASKSSLIKTKYLIELPPRF